jgi:cellulose synthase/poly-beta-1,6-N-acetylglucosamine synthase-like glycosyltransferase
MDQPEILDSDIRAMQQWLRTAWQQLSDPSLTTFSRRELRNQMKQCSADLRSRLQMQAEQQP